MRRGEIEQAAAQVRAVLVDAREELVLLDHREHRARRGAGQRVAAEGRPVRAGRERLVEPLLHEERADGHAAREALGERDRVALHAVVLRAQPATGAADARLHLVEEEQRAVLVADLPQLLQVAGRRGEHASLALHRLDHDARDVRAHHRAHRRGVSIGDVCHARERGAEALLILGVPGEGHRAHGPPVKRVVEGDEAIALGLAVDEEPAARELEHRLVGLRAGVAEEGAIEAELLAELVGEADVLGVVEIIGSVEEARGLLGDGRGEPRVGVAERGDGDAGAEVEVASALGVPHLAALAAIEDQRRLPVVAEEALLPGGEQGVLIGGRAIDAHGALGHAFGGAHRADLRRAPGRGKSSARPRARSAGLARRLPADRG